MLIDNLFSQALIEPALRHEKTRLQIVSGFATGSMARHHLDELAKCGANASIELIVGMTNRSGIEKAQHKVLCDLAQNRAYGMDFSCRYIARNSPVHAKTYVWLNDSGPFAAFCGSANYTQPGFGLTQPKQIEAVTQADPVLAAKFYDERLPYTIDCLDETVTDYVTLTKAGRADDRMTRDKEMTRDKDRVTLTLLSSRKSKTGETETPKRSGINWGQRGSRNKNEAYINIPAKHRDFFPERRQKFAVLTDDDASFIFVRAQDGGKGLETPQNNALLGEYIRKRMELPSGEFITKQHLLDYGRTDVTFIKIDEETYLMDFSPSGEAEHSIESGET